VKSEGKEQGARSREKGQLLAQRGDSMVVGVDTNNGRNDFYL
jgi:hypothetical protein